MMTYYINFKMTVLILLTITNYLDKEYYNWSGFTNFDTLVNYGSYYWLKDGPNPVTVSGGDIKLSGTWNFNFDDVKQEYGITELSGRNPTLYLARGGNYTFETNQTEDFWIQTEAGNILGTQAITSSKSTREIYGVTNNGGDRGGSELSGNITFSVPEIDAQAFYEKPILNYYLMLTL